MNNYLKYLKVFLYIFIPLLFLNLLLSIFYYFNIFDDNVINYLRIIIFPISMFIGGIYLGNKANKRGWLEGIKIGLFISIIFFIIGILIYKFSLKRVLYYLILVFASVIGSMIGISKKRTG